MIIVKELAHNALMVLPPVQRFVRRWHSTGINDDPEAARRAYEFFTAAAPVKDRDVLEIGPGQTMRVLKYALADGARSATAVDIIDYFAADPSARGGVDLRTYDGRVLPVADASVDLVWSFNAFEHLRWPAVTVAECARVLRPGGKLVCQVDLRDHYTSVEARFADHLRYPGWLWNAMTWNRAAFTNRVRYSEWLRLFAGAGFSVESATPHVSDVLARVYDGRRDLQRFSREDAATTSFRATVVKR